MIVKVNLLLLGIVLSLLVSIICWMYFFSIYELKYEVNKTTSLSNSVYKIKSIPLNSLGNQIPLRSVTNQFEIQSGKEEIIIFKIFKDYCEIHTKKSLHNSIVIKASTNLASFPTLIEIH